MHKSLLLGLGILFYGLLHAQANADTLRLTLPQAEELFLRNNLSLVAEHYNIDAAAALKQQARYWDNPVLVTDQNLYDGKFMKYGSQRGQVFLQLQQLIRTAGKRNKLIQLANDDLLTAQQQFRDAMRNLRFLLQTTFAQAVQLQETRRIYLQELDALQRLATGMDAQYKAGNVSLKDNVRIKALLYSLQTDEASLEMQLADVSRDLQQLIRPGEGKIIEPVGDLIDARQVSEPSLQLLLDSAHTNRPDLELSRINELNQQHNLSYQRALAIPDVTVATEYDRKNGYVPNYFGMGIQLPLPVLNRNRGNIRAAEFTSEQARVQMQQTQEEVDGTVKAAFSKYRTALQVARNEAPELEGPFDQLMQNVVQSYRQRQIGLVEFIDFFGSYRDARIRRLQQDEALRNAAAEINFTTNANIISIN